LKQYILSLSFDEPLFMPTDWQDYPLYKKEHLGDDESSSMPEWYHYYNMHRGTESLFLLPDIRGQKEEQYQNDGLRNMMDKNQDPFTKSDLIQKAGKKKSKKENEESDADDPAPYIPKEIIAPGDTRPWMKQNYKTDYTEFIDKFEDEKFKQVHEIRLRLSENKVDFFDSVELNDAMGILKLAGKKYPMEPYYLWREGIIRVAHKYKKEKIAEALPMVYKQYLFKIENNILPFINRQEMQDINRAKNFANDHKRWILRGRKLKGEPKNFDF
jgi:hypothetical protein